MGGLAPYPPIKYSYMNKITTILDIIREANPETKELSFGCRLLVKDCNGKKHIVTYASDADYAGLIWDNGETGSYVEDWVLKIIGHPLYPAHLLVALGGNSWSMNSHGWFYNQFDYEKFQVKPTQPLEPQLQSNPELVDTLYKLLKEEL